MSKRTVARSNQEAEFAAALKAVAETRDRDAFARLFEYFAPRIKAYMRRLGADDALAEELMQEAMISVWRRADSYNPKAAAVSTWMFAIARNKRIDGVRRAKRPEIDADDPTLSEPIEAPDQAYDRFQSAERIKAALADLPETHAEALRLAYYEGLSQSEIAKRLDAPLGTVKSRMRLGLGRLRRALGGESEDD